MLSFSMHVVVYSSRAPRKMMALYESEDSESLNETIVANGVARVASNAEKLATSEVRSCFLRLAWAGLGRVVLGCVRLG